MESFRLRLLGFRTRLGGSLSKIPEFEADDELFERLAQVTGYSISRLSALRLPLRPRRLPIGFRSGFCPRCWMGRRRLQAAYLKCAWADPWALVCERHGTLMSDRMAADRAGGWSTWSECFADRNCWAPLAKLSLRGKYISGAEDRVLDALGRNQLPPDTLGIRETAHDTQAMPNSALTGV
jgi:hypothetical protein